MKLFVIFLDILGFARSIRRQADELYLSESNIREEWREEIKKALEKAKKDNLIKGFSPVTSPPEIPEMSRDSWVVFTESANATYNLFKILFKVKLPLEIVIDFLDFSFADFPENIADVLNSDEMMEFLKKDILKSYRDWYKEKYKISVVTTFILSKEKAYLAFGLDRCWVKPYSAAEYYLFSDVSQEIVKSKCKEPTLYTRGYTYMKEFYAVGDLLYHQTDENPHGRSLSHIFDKAFIKRITASPDDESFMDKVFCFPDKACEYATERMKRLAGSLRCIDYKEACSKFNEFRKEFISNIVSDLIKKATHTRSTKESAGIDRILLWVGETGSGKTTFINHLFLKYRKEFDKDEIKIIWIRFSVFWRGKPKNIDDLRMEHCKKIFIILRDYYKNKEDFCDYEKEFKTWNDKIEGLNTNNPYFISFVHRLINFFYSKGWAFIFILDNIDQYEDKDITGEIIKYSLQLSRKPVRSLVILVSRIDTVNDHMTFFRRVNQNVEDPWFIRPPDFHQVFEKRLDYITKYTDSPKILKEYYIGGKRVQTSEGYIARNLTKYFLTRVPQMSHKYFITELANHNIRDMFEMIISILKSHIIDVTEIPIQTMIEHLAKYKHTEDVSDVFYDETLRIHLVIWALMLKNYFFYSDEKDRTWILNVYNVRSETDSYWLKRLLIDFFIYMKNTFESKYKYILYSQLKKVFAEEMSFEEDELKYNLQILCNRSYKSPLLSFEVKDDGNHLYSLTPTGELYATQITSLYIYLELVLEDMLLPRKKDSEYDVEIKLLQFDPLKKIEYFNLKRIHVRTVLDFLECREELEKRQHNNFYSESTDFKRDYFPKLRERIEDQAQKIAKALGIVL